MKESRIQKAIRQKIEQADLNILVTAEQLKSDYGALIVIEDIALILGVQKKTITESISAETFEIPVTKIGKKWFATAYEVAQHVVKNRSRFAA